MLQPVSKTANGKKKLVLAPPRPINMENVGEFGRTRVLPGDHNLPAPSVGSADKIDPASKIAQYSNWLAQRRIYFHKVPVQIIQKLKPYLEKSGATIEEWISLEMNLIVTNDPDFNDNEKLMKRVPDIVQIARDQFKVRLLSLDKLKSLLSVVFPYTAPPLTDKLAKKPLQGGLENAIRKEKLFGLSTTTTGSKGTKKYFTGNYVLVEELSGKYQPICCEDYGSGSEIKWPMLRFENHSAYTVFAPRTTDEADEINDENNADPRLMDSNASGVHSAVPGSNAFSTASRLSNASGTVIKQLNQKLPIPILPVRMQRDPTDEDELSSVRDKSGYCENCKEKYKSYSEHIKSKKHRKYAEHKPNFENLDKLIKKVKDRIIKIGDQFDRTLLGNHAQALGCTLADSEKLDKGSILKRTFAEDVEATATYSGCNEIAIEDIKPEQADALTVNKRVKLHLTESPSVADQSNIMTSAQVQNSHLAEPSPFSIVTFITDQAQTPIKSSIVEGKFSENSPTNISPTGSIVESVDLGLNEPDENPTSTLNQSIRPNNDSDATGFSLAESQVADSSTDIKSKLPVPHSSAGNSLNDNNSVLALNTPVQHSKPTFSIITNESHLFNDKLQECFSPDLPLTKMNSLSVNRFRESEGGTQYHSESPSKILLNPMNDTIVLEKVELPDSHQTPDSTPIIMFDNMLNESNLTPLDELREKAMIFETLMDQVDAEYHADSSNLIEGTCLSKETSPVENNFHPKDCLLTAAISEVPALFQVGSTAQVSPIKTQRIITTPIGQRGSKISTEIIQPKVRPSRSCTAKSTPDSNQVIPKKYTNTSSMPNNKLNMLSSEPKQEIEDSPGPSRNFSILEKSNATRAENPPAIINPQSVDPQYKRTCYVKGCCQRSGKTNLLQICSICSLKFCTIPSSKGGLHTEPHIDWHQCIPHDRYPKYYEDFV